LAIASGGGHWVQLLRLLPAFEGCELAMVTVSEQYRSTIAPRSRFYVVPDATRWNKLRLVYMMLKVACIVLRERPQIIISTGAAPGYFALRFGKLLGTRTIWLDSVANVERLSLCGECIGNHADLWLTQWPQLARDDGPYYAGTVH
jgi:UDP-N-acetylglucosamine:LPS N-acetylglucosamine transferase